MMFCKKCGKQLPDDSLVCDSCGEPTTKAVSSKQKDERSNPMLALAIISYILSGITFIIGLYKMLAYQNMDSYPYTHINAYVGGDAYNYIINGTYATAFFVLSVGLLLFGILLLIYGEIKLQRQS